MSDSADSPDDPGVVRGRKRERNIGEWRQNEAKNKRNRGEEYVSRATGRHIPKRSVGPPTTMFHCDCIKFLLRMLVFILKLTEIREIT